MVRTFARTVATLCAAGLVFAGCNSEARTEELIQARMDAERVKALATETAELKKENEELRDANKALENQVLMLKAAKAQAQVAAVKPQGKKSATGGNATAAQVEEAKQQLTGGGSFK